MELAVSTEVFLSWGHIGYFLLWSAGQELGKKWKFFFQRERQEWRGSIKLISFYSIRFFFLRGIFHYVQVSRRESKLDNSQIQLSRIFQRNGKQQTIR